jgi:xylulose-5-phosphate/fructose-6-phosphate phosphoketolase
MIVLATPKGWTGPKVVDGQAVEGTFHAHQIPLTSPRTNPRHLEQLHAWLQSYRPEELFDDAGRLNAAIALTAPAGDRRMSANPHANGGLLLRDLVLPDFRSQAVAVKEPGAVHAEDTRVLGRFLRDVIAANAGQRNLLFADDGLNRPDAAFEVTARQTAERIAATGINDGRVVEMLSEHQCQGGPRAFADWPLRL